MEIRETPSGQLENIALGLNKFVVALFILLPRANKKIKDDVCVFVCVGKGSSELMLVYKLCKFQMIANIHVNCKRVFMPFRLDPYLPVMQLSFADNLKLILILMY